MVAAAASEWTSGPTPTYISANSFSVTGDQTTILHVGRRIRTTNTAGTRYATITRSVFGALTTVTVENDSGTLDSGLSALSYSISSADNTSIPFISYNQQCGRLIKVSTTQIRLDPQDGNTVWINTGSAWKRRIIPSAGITAANTNIHIDGVAGSNLAANITYYVYLFDNAGTLTMDFSTTAPDVDATSGLKIKTGVASRLLIGMVRTNASSQFQLALSWYRRRAITQSASLTADRTTTSTSDVELHSEIRVPFLSWAEEAVVAAFAGRGSNSGAGNACRSWVTLDGIVTGVTAMGGATSPTSACLDNHSISGQTTVTEGYHYVTLTVNVSAGTGTWHIGSPAATLYALTQG